MTTEWDEDDSTPDDGEDPDESDTDADQELVDTRPCPACGKLVYDDADACPRCGHYLSREDAPPRKPVWVVAVVVLCLAAMLYWAIRM